MSARLEIGDERYTVEQGELVPDDEDDVLQVARAKSLSLLGPFWVSEAVRSGELSSYDPDPDCTLATVISRRVQGQARCGAPAPPKRGIVY